MSFFLKLVFQVPAESVLLPISTHLVHFLNKRQPKLQARDAGIWWGTLGKLQLMLRKAARALYQNDKVSRRTNFSKILTRSDFNKDFNQQLTIIN